MKYFFLPASSNESTNRLISDKKEELRPHRDQTAFSLLILLSTQSSSDRGSVSEEGSGLFISVTLKIRACSAVSSCDRGFSCLHMRMRPEPGHKLSETVFKSLCRMSLFTLSSHSFAFFFFLFCFWSTAPGSETGQTTPGGSESGLFVWVFSGCVILLLVVLVLLVLLWRYHRHHCVAQNQNQSASVSLNTLAVPKRDSISSDNNGSDRSDVVFPLRPSDSMVCRHYERVSTDYGPPVYIVQEITSQTPTNIYYKVWYTDDHTLRPQFVVSYTGNTGPTVTMCTGNCWTTLFS